ncbi:RCC1 domain-containing protein [Cohnella sp. 56]|uniref:RCC1 domain-containing protein n=1 Tax=Cohnella sp. 56 TaxID=3113722 RepID=UPI0030E8F242
MRRITSIWLCVALLIGIIPIYGPRAHAAAPANEPQLVAGYYHSVGLATDGTVWGWGGNEFGGLANGTKTNSSIPVAAKGMNDVVSIAAGVRQSFAIKKDGTVWAWGSNNYGQLGDGSTTDRLLPVQIDIGDVAALSGGIGYHTLALKKDGTVWAWGDNESGELGDGTKISRSVPGPVPGLSDIVAVSAGGYHSMALKSDGTVWAWGLNTAGEMGNNTESAAQTAPVKVSGLDHVVAISAGNYHNLALKENGTVWAWGDNGQGRLGDGTATKRIVPVQVQELSGVKAIAAGGFHSVALKEDGTVWAWGHNNYGQVGDGTTTQRNKPVPIGGLSGVMQIAANSFSSAALREDGSIWSWGYGDYGQLGTGNKAASNVPVQSKAWLDGTPPAVSSGTIAASDVTTDSATLTWAKASDNMSGQTDLEYRVYRSFKNNIQSIADIEAKGIAVNAYTADIDSLRLTGLLDGMPYYFNVIVKDKAGQKSAYTMQQVVTVAIPTYSVIYRGNGNTGGKVPVDDYYYYEGEQAVIWGNVRGLVRAGYTFANWNTAADGSGTAYAADEQATIGQADLVLFAQWSKNPTYNVIYRGNGHTGGDGPVDDEAYEAGASVTVLGNTDGFIRKGYSFVGWNTKADGSGEVYAAGDTVAMGTSDLELYAQWTANPTYGVTYEAPDADSGAVPVDSGSYEAGAEFTVLGNTGGLARAGYTFAGWTLAADGSGTAYQAGAKLTMGAAAVKLYAQWTANPTYGVTYEEPDADSGTVPVDSGAYEAGAEFTVLGNTGGLARAGYTFAGWTLAADGSGTAYQAGAKLTMGAAAVKLYAQWTANPTYGVTYEAPDADSGTAPVDSGSYETGAEFTVLGNTGDLTRVGYTFAGWTLAADGSGTAYQAGAKLTMGAAAVKLYAQWTANPTYGVTYEAPDADSGTAPVDSGSYEAGAEFTVLGNTGDLAKAGYAFAGWTLAADGSGTAYQAGAKLTMGAAAVKLYAQWTANPNQPDPDPSQNPDPDPSQNPDPDPVLEPKLDALELSAGTWNMAFDAGTTAYTITLEANVYVLRMTAAAASDRQSIAASVYDADHARLYGPIVLRQGAAADIRVSTTAASIQVVVTGEDGTACTYTLHIERQQSLPDPVLPVQGPTPVTSFSLTIGGTARTDMATAASTGDGSLDIVLRSQALIAGLAGAAEGTIIVISAPDIRSNAVTVQLDAASLSALQAKQAVLELRTAIGSYTLPLNEVRGDTGRGGTVRLAMRAADESVAQRLSQAALQSNLAVIASPVACELAIVQDDHISEVVRFHSYVKRELALPAGVDPKGVTAVVVEADGTLRPVPTEIIERDGNYYAVVRSLTNSAYALVRPTAAEFADLAGHWAQGAVAELASRLIVNGYGSGLYRPNDAVSRAEFAAMLVRAMGLPSSTAAASASAFVDLKAGAWYLGIVEQASSYALLRGDANGRFRPDDTLTREEAFTIVMRAMKLAGYESVSGVEETESILSAYADQSDIHAWARAEAATAVQAGLIQGAGGNLRPSGHVTRAEAAAMLQRLLKQAGLINR